MRIFLNTHWKHRQQKPKFGLREERIEEEESDEFDFDIPEFDDLDEEIVLKIKKAA